MTNWREFVLGDLVKFKGGSVFPKEAQGVVSGDLPFVKVSDMNRTENWKDLHGAENWLSASAAKTLKAAIHAPGAVAFAKIGIALTYNRRRRIVRPTLLDNNMMSASTISKDLASDFLYHLLQTLDFNTVSAGSALPYLTVGTLNKIPVRLPPPEQQKDISCLLNQLDDKIELNRQMNETLEAMAQAIFRDWFVDFGPTRRKLEGAVDPITIIGGLVQDIERAQALADLFPDKLGDDGLPAGWEERQVGDVTLLLRRGLAPSYSDEGILVINQKCIRNKAVNLALARRHDAVKRPAKDRLLEEYDVVVNSTGVGTLGRVATVRGLKEAATADSHVTICRADTSKVSKLVLSLFMEGQEALIETLGHGSTGQTELSPASLSAMVFPVAPEPVQLAFESLVMPLRDLVTSNSEHSLTLAETRDLLLPKLMSGEIRLSEAEVLAEAAQ